MTVFRLIWSFWNHFSPKSKCFLENKLNQKYLSILIIISFLIKANGYMCGGTIINKRYVLTAMHCLSDARQNKHPVDKVRVVVGEHNICDGVNEGGQVIKW